ncbi:MAG: RDD family protein [Cocleimonas sp.]|nr:RDD family protein [Cocleimonas sp.]
MNCWITLGIEEYSDKKAIKMAYAKLLKITKPDDDPQGFKELHAAYKEALELVSEYKESSAPQWFTPSEKNKEPISFDDSSFLDVVSQDVALQDNLSQDKNQEGDSFGNESNGGNEPEQPYSTPSSAETNTDQISVDSNQVLEELEAVYGTSKPEKIDAQFENEDEQDYPEVEHFHGAEAQEKLEKDWEYLEAQTKLIINTKATKSTISDWQFLEEIPSMVDLEFRSQASDLVFEIVSEINEISLQEKVLLVKSPILNYLNNLFHWESKWKHYEELYGEQVDAVFPYLTETNPQNTEASSQSKDLHYYRRGAAYLIDMGLVFAFSKALHFSLPFLLGNNFMGVLLTVATIYGLIIIPLLEVAPNIQASIGKNTLGLKVVNEAGLRITWYQSFWRAIATGFCVGAFKIVVWINFFLIYKKGILLQDLMSKSYVVKVRK